MTIPDKIEHLTPKMREAALLLATGIGPSIVSERVKISRSQLYEWRNDDQFNSILQRETRLRLRLARQELQAATATAAQELIDLMKNARSETVRLKACLVLLAALPGRQDWQSHTDDQHRRTIRTAEILDQLELLSE